MKKIKEKMTVVSADGKVTFYLEKRSDVCLYDCLHLDVIDDVEELRLDIPGIRFIYDLISDDDNEKMVTTKAYALEKMQRRANKNNFSL